MKVLDSRLEVQENHNPDHSPDHNQSPDLNPFENLWKDLRIAVHRHSPSNFTEFEKTYKEEWEKIPKFRCVKLVQTYPRRLEAVFTAKGMSKKY